MDLQVFAKADADAGKALRRIKEILEYWPAFDGIAHAQMAS